MARRRGGSVLLEALKRLAEAGPAGALQKDLGVEAAVAKALEDLGLLRREKGQKVGVPNRCFITQAGLDFLSAKEGGARPLGEALEKIPGALKRVEERLESVERSVGSLSSSLEALRAPAKPRAGEEEFLVALREEYERLLRERGGVTPFLEIPTLRASVCSRLGLDGGAFDEMVLGLQGRYVQLSSATLGERPGGIMSPSGVYYFYLSLIAG